MNQSNNKSFIIHQLSGINIKFTFDICDTLFNFRKNINGTTHYTLIYKGNGLIYANDDGFQPIKQLIEMLKDEYAQELLELDVIDLYLTANMGYPKRREGKLLLSHRMVSILEESNHTPSILLCPISMSLIQYAVKVNERFYELENISEYLSSEINKFFNRGDAAKLPICPLRMPISMEFMTAILQGHIDRTGDKFTEITKSSVECYFIKNLIHESKDQIEYNNLIKNQLS